MNTPAAYDFLYLWMWLMVASLAVWVIFDFRRFSREYEQRQARRAARLARQRSKPSTTVRLVHVPISEASRVTPTGQTLHLVVAAPSRRNDVGPSGPTGAAKAG